MAYHFLVPHIKSLIDDGNIVELVCTNLKGYDELLKSKLDGKYLIPIKYVDLNRSPFKFRNIRGYLQLKKLINEGNYDLISTNEPVMGITTRLAARGRRKKGLKVIYTAHGFHFFKGGPISSWILFYPIERIMSFITDAIVTINKEDYGRAQKFNAKEVFYIPGIGLDTKAFSNVNANREEKCAEIGVSSKSIILFSVGELGERKNHEVAIRALSKTKNKKLIYVICGEGELERYLKDLCKKLNILDRVFFLGYRKDIAELCNISDIYVFPSKREGLGIAALEGMSASLPLISSYVNGIRDYTKNAETGFCLDPQDTDGFAKAMDLLAGNEALRKKIGKNNAKVANSFDISNVKHIFKNIYNSVMTNGRTD